MAVAASMSDCLEYVEDAGDATGDDEVGDGEMETCEERRRRFVWIWRFAWIWRSPRGDLEIYLDLEIWRIRMRAGSRASRHGSSVQLQR
ncbi:hypothetical protein ACFX16_014882 [Malus domestica]